MQLTSIKKDFYFTRLNELTSKLSTEEISAFLDSIEDAWSRGAGVMFCGNGGSAMSALHMATDLSKGVRQATGRALNCFTPTDNIGLLTAYANDIEYNDAFAEQVNDRLSAGDLLIAISVSGRSENLLRAARKARSSGIRVIGLCGFDGGPLKALCDLSLVVPSSDYQLVEDIHMALGHMAMQHLSDKSQVN
ncbi:hypothetical protein TH60_21370 [Pantoea ananatis]|jgi:D-sedoheptulose 7-phosphate isomerase|uniref:SIS domain-containing protein n=1 Tax=Pantoea ananas TaxID=553 RepID=UPI0023505F5F|nr:SIS domain-containing protein [Pantoea ananatis]MDC7872045.1 hypothetical protein [Pantoea ananatis]